VLEENKILPRMTLDLPSFYLINKEGFSVSIKAKNHEAESSDEVKYV
jgi:hypothetical protein